ncbi:MAG: membrane-bound PQQ-dependent dehydrogenase, glucose/quinate/shikimate family [Dehalococcoidia bacterium]
MALFGSGEQAAAGPGRLMAPFGAVPLLVALLMVVSGSILAWGGGRLLALGGSPYYLAAGAALVGTGFLVGLRRRAAAWVYALFLVLTIVWAVVEAGFDVWSLLPRVWLPSIAALVFLLRSVRESLDLRRPLLWLNPVLAAVGTSVLLCAFWMSRFVPADVTPEALRSPSSQSAVDWAHFGGSLAGQRYASSSEINAANVNQLELAWSYRTGDRLLPGEATSSTFESTPLRIGDSLFLCTPHNVVISLDADTGRERWRFDPHVNLNGATHIACRGVAFHDSGPGTQLTTCARRLLMGTVDDRLLAIDAATGRPCGDFGSGGSIDLTQGIGSTLPGYHYVTSPPVVVSGVAIVGSFVFDNQSTDEPPGVVRAYDAISGRLVWAWDVLHPLASPPLAAGQTYPRNTPNFWSVGSADPNLGLVYLPIGNTPPDFYGVQRSAEQERYSSSIVALEAATGNVRWSFQTVHHDVWDYDVPAQPVLIDLQTEAGLVPALLAPTKRGEVFVLDRRTGTPVVPVEEKPVPQWTDSDERLAPTQPFPTDFPSFAPPRLEERSMWGTTPFDQLWCRLQFRRAHYEGLFTPPTQHGSIIYPGVFGAINWGSVSVDPRRQVMVVNTSWLPFVQKLIPRREADRLGIVPYGMPRPDGAPPLKEGVGIFAQVGTPFAIESAPFLSPLGFPCHAPPWGGLSAVDLRTRKLLWQRPLGTTRDAAPLGLPLPTGVFNQGGSLVTAGRLIFIGATIDDYLRAFDLESGEELWKARLPAGGQSTPMTYYSDKSKRQYVVISAGGHGSLQRPPGDYVLAYALPRAR